MLRFGRFELHLVERRLFIDNQPIPLGARAFDLLVALAERPGELISKGELLERVWPGLVVEEGNIAVQVNGLRKVLGGQVISTVPGRGYCFTARVEGGAVAAATMTVPTVGLPTHLPRSLPALWGRTEDLAMLGALIEGHPLVSVTGAGGIGKTLLVQHLLDIRRHAHPHGVCWVELAGVADAAALPATIAASLGLRLGGGDAFNELALALGSLNLLLALDNAEHLADAVGRLATLLTEAVPGLKLVVTSQARLGVAAERVMRLATLELPSADAGVEEALAAGSVALFVDRAQAADARFALTEDNVAAVIAVCRSLDGLPLAIELAAARAPMLGIHGLASAMDDRLQFLTRNRNRAAPARQQTLRATLAWSHGLLDVTQRAVFRRLAVVTGSCSLQVAQHIAADSPGDGPIDVWSVLDGLDALVDRSLVAVLSGDHDASPRYRLLETPKAFALEQLAAAAEVEATQRRLAVALTSVFAATWDAYFCGEISISQLRHVLAPDCDNARAAIASEHGSGSVRLQISAHLLRALPHSSFAERLALADACELLLSGEPSLYLRMFGWLTIAVTWVNPRRRRSRSAIEKAVALAREHELDTGDRRYLYYALGVSAVAFALNKELDSASAALTEMREIEDAVWVPSHLAWRADAERLVAGLRGDLVERLRVARECAARSSDSNDKVRIASDMIQLIDSELAAGQAEAAVATGRKLVAMLSSSGDEYQLTLARCLLSAALLALDAVAEARPLAAAGWVHARRFEVQAEWADYLALLAALEQRPASAALLCGYATTAYATIEQPREVNEAAAFDRVCRLAADALGDNEFSRLETEGRALRFEDVAGIAFRTVDP